VVTIRAVSFNIQNSTFLYSLFSTDSFSTLAVRHENAEAAAAAAAAASVRTTANIK